MSVPRRMAHGKTRLERIEPVLLALGLILFVLINVATADKAPAVWCDEVMYQDPAVNLYQGHGFHSAAWFEQGMDKFWAGNVPLYQFVLFGWLKIFGFSLRTVRSMHYALTAIAVFITWLAVRRHKLINVPAHRLVFCLTLCLCSAMTFVYRSARPESLAFVLAAFAFLAFSFRPRALLLLTLVLCGAFLTWNGLQLAVYSALICGVALVFSWKKFLPQFLALGAGCAMGGCLLWVFYHRFGVWDDFVHSIRHFTVANQHTQYAHIRSYGPGFGHKLKEIPALFIDYSFIPLFMLASLIVTCLARAGALNWRNPLCLGIAASVLIPVCMNLLGVFPIYYMWMAIVPLAIGVFAQLVSFKTVAGKILSTSSVTILLFVTCFMGLPRRLLVASLEWHARDYDVVMALAAPYVGQGKLVYTEFAGYYAAKQHSAVAVLPTYTHLLTDAERERIFVAIINPENASTMARDLGGEWRDTGMALKPNSAAPLFGLRENLDSRQYNLKVFVREGHAGDSAK